MKTLFATLAALAIASPALASGPFAPPEKYQGAPSITTHIIAVPLMELQKRCNNKAFPARIFYGCAMVYKNPARCVVFIPDKSFPNYAWPVGGVLIVEPGHVLEHELGHCNGWPADHPKG